MKASEYGTAHSPDLIQWLQLATKPHENRILNSWITATKMVNNLVYIWLMISF